MTSNTAAMEASRYLEGAAPSWRRFGRGALLVFLAALPLYNLVVYQHDDGWLLPGLNSQVGPLRISDVFLLGWLVVVLPVLVWNHFPALKRDRYLCLSVALLAWRIVRDVWLATPEFGSYIPASILLLAIYAVASRVDPKTIPLELVGKWTIGFYLALGGLQIAAGELSNGRMQSVFGNPNFLALFMLHAMLLLEFHQDHTDWRLRVWQALAVAGIVLSKTRSVFLGVVVLLSFRLHGAWKFVAAGLAVLVLAAFPYIVRMDGDDTMELNGRLSMWRQVADNAHLFNWTLGSGHNAIVAEKVLPMFDDQGVIGYYQPQCDYIQVAAEYGLVGLGLVVAALCAYVAQAWRFRRDRIVGTILAYLAVLAFLQLAECEVFFNAAAAAVLGLGTARVNQLRLAKRTGAEGAA